MIDLAQIPPVAPSFPMHGTRLVPSLSATPGHSALHLLGIPP